MTYTYACMLVLLVVQASNDLCMMETYASPLLAVCKADENNAKLQGVCPSAPDVWIVTMPFCARHVVKVQHDSVSRCVWECDPRSLERQTSSRSQVFCEMFRLWLYC